MNFAASTRRRIATLFVLGLLALAAGTLSLGTRPAYATTCGAGSDIGSGQCRVFLTSGTSWTVPGDWNSNQNTIEVIGGGGGGARANGGAAGGGGGGAYSNISNLSLTSGASITYQVGTGGIGGATAGAGGGLGSDTFFNRTAGAANTCADTSSICAKGGSGGTTAVQGTGGAFASGIGTTKYSGGNAGAGANGGSGAGGAGGPLGAGANGGSGGGYGASGGGGNGNGTAGATTATNTGANGGDNSSGSGHGTGGAAGVNAGTAGTSGGGGGGGGGSSAGGGGGAGGAGGTGIEWDSTHGSGGGGGGGGSTESPGPSGVGGAGALYGGGGGGSGYNGGGSTSGNGGAGAQGFIVIKYSVPVTPARTIRLFGSLSGAGVPIRTLRIIGTRTTPESRPAKTVTANGNAQIDTAQSKFGGASGLFDGTDDYLSISADADTLLGVSSEPFTIDMWIRPTSVTGLHMFATRGGSVVDWNTSNGQFWSFFQNGTAIMFQNATGNPASPNVAVGGTLAINTWYHVAVVYDGTNGYVFVDGVVVASGAFAAAVAPTTNTTVRFGVDVGSANDFAGHSDEIRISKGIARWTTNFTPPSAPYTHDAYSKLLLHMDGTDASTAFTDESYDTTPNRQLIIYPQR